MTKTALITGITGQDGSYLSKLLLSKGYHVYGTSRKISESNTWRLKYLGIKKKIKLFKSTNLEKHKIFSFIKMINPDEIYNLSGISSVNESFKNPALTFKANTTDCIKLLDIIFQLGRPIKFYQASSSEMFGNAKKRCSENTLFNPNSPYGISKLSAHQITANYRKNYGIFASTGILFNHESPLRGEKFVTKKIISGLVKIKLKKIKSIKVGNIDVKRDWGHAKDFTSSMYKILQSDKPDDFVISSEENFSVKDLINIASKILKLDTYWKGSGLNRVLIDKNNNIIVKIDKTLFRPKDIISISGNSTKAKKKLNWQPKIKFRTLIKEMIKYELQDSL